MLAFLLAFPGAQSINELSLLVLGLIEVHEGFNELYCTLPPLQKRRKLPLKGISVSPPPEQGREDYRVWRIHNIRALSSER